MDAKFLHLTLELVKAFLTIELAWLALLLFLRVQKEIYLYIPGFAMIGCINLFHGFFSATNLPVNQNTFVPGTRLLSNTLFPVFIYIVIKRPKNLMLFLITAGVGSLTIFVFLLIESDILPGVGHYYRPLELIPLTAALIVWQMIRRIENNSEFKVAAYTSLFILGVQSIVMIFSHQIYDRFFMFAHVLQILHTMPVWVFIVHSLYKEINYVSASRTD